MRAVFETGFDIFYLVFVVCIGIVMVRQARQKQYRLFGWMAIVLGCGDAFHLVPRAMALCTTGFADYVVPMGIGKLITSVTMTLFYVMLYYVWRARYKVTGRNGLTALVWGLAAIRIGLCLFPQNAWTQAQ